MLMLPLVSTKHHTRVFQEKSSKRGLKENVLVAQAGGREPAFKRNPLKED